MRSLSSRRTVDPLLFLCGTGLASEAPSSSAPVAPSGRGLPPEAGTPRPTTVVECSQMGLALVLVLAT
jgi:hypothetical protein